MFKTLRNALKIEDIRKKLIFTFLMLVVVRFGSQLPIPGANRDYFQAWFAQQTGDAFNFFDAFTGGVEPGGLRSQSDIRLLICYMLASVQEPLSKEDIELITLYVFDDLTQNEIGVRFGISQKAVSKRIEQIRKHLNKFS